MKPEPLSPNRMAAMLAAVLLLAAACASGPAIQRYAIAKKLPRMEAVVLLAPDIYFRNMQAHHAWEKWIDLADRLTQETGLLVLGPDEFKVLTSLLVTDLCRETDMVGILRDMGIAPQNAVALKITLTESWQLVESVVSDEKRSHSGQAEFQSDLSFSAEAWHIDTNRPVFTLTDRQSGTVADNPTASDSRPDMTAFANRNYAALVRLLRDDFGGGPPPEPRAAMVTFESAHEVARYTHQQLPSLAETLEGKDDIDREAALRARLEYRNPNADRPALKVLMQSAEGLLAGPSDPCLGIRQGDVILTADGSPVNRTYQLVRRLRLARRGGRPAVLALLRDGKGVTVEVRCSP